MDSNTTLPIVGLLSIAMSDINSMLYSIFLVIFIISSLVSIVITVINAIKNDGKVDKDELNDINGKVNTLSEDLKNLIDKENDDNV